MNKPNTLYRISINHHNKEYKIFETEEQAIEFARSMIEADGNHVFMHAKRGSNGLLVLRWMEWTNIEPCVISKTIGIANQKELKEYAQWCRKQKDIEFAKKWDKTRQNLIKLNEKQKITHKKAQNNAICWID